MEYYTYAYLRQDGTPYYIGKGKERRANRPHIRGHIDMRPSKDRILFLKKNLTEEEAFKHEIYMISIFGRKDLGTGILRNLTNGGEGQSGTIFSKSRIENIKKSKLGKPSLLKGKTYKQINEDQYLNRIEKLRISNIGKKLTEEHKKKISNSKKGNIAWNKGLALESNYIYEYKNPIGNSIIIRSLNNFCKQNNLNQTCMFRLIGGKQKQHKGWTFVKRQEC